ncbi:unnamed protein product [Miscanthus lutarioriparius]|uniref:Uncharacterized protein n=1 Tax=Miscanthus lutarioriparius TaxID=422564 RepID=A0A811SNQ8_9POAL|nr:unnamed protein product [Miscanthus lutarioriparius]
MVSSTLAQEAVNQVLSRIKDVYEEKSDAKEHIERMEMAHIKLEAALETTNSRSDDDKLTRSTAVLRFDRFAEGASEFLSLRLSESTDVVGVAVRCLHLFTPYLSSTAKTVKTKLTQQQDHDYTQRYNATSSSSKSLPCDIYLEPVIQVYLLGHVTLSVRNNRQRAVVDGESETNPIGDCPYLKLGARFWPHASFEDLSPGIDSSATEIINGVAAQRGMYAKISFEQLTDIMIPKAVDCLRRDVEATSYQILWKSKHGGSYIQVEKTSRRGTTQKVRQRKQPNRWPGKKVQGWASVNNEFICSWIRHASTQLKDSVVDWIQKERRLPQPLLLKTNSCFRDCPIMLLSLQDHRSLVRTIKSHSTFSG